MEKTILLVDDEAGIRRVLKIALSDMGYTVLTAQNGVEALEIFKDTRPPIVLTDIKMPEMDGIELLRRLKLEHPETEIIIITGHGDLDLAIKSVKYEATDFVTKPINDEVLEIALNRACERIEMRRQIQAYTQNLEQMVQEKTQQLVGAERMAAVGQTVAGLSHAIKNITGGLKGGAFVLEKGIELNDQKYLMQGWEMIKGNVDKIANLSLDLLNYARDRQIQFQSCNPNQPAQEVIDLMRPRAEAHEIHLVGYLSDDLVPCRLDPDLISRCLLNLVANAIDACIDEAAADGVKKVTIRTQKKRGWGVEYQILDNGCGMDETTKQNLFKRFFSTKGSRGTGIGLMITKKIVDDHRGTIQVESKSGSGSKFTLELPENPDA
ncbi:MAG: response regulator [Deltaproteobacteria bacterium]|nr:response regulator [Deltaproteobacteria bacterium]